VNFFATTINSEVLTLEMKTTRLSHGLMQPATHCSAASTVSDETYANDNWSGGVDQGVVFSELGCNVYIPDAKLQNSIGGKW
jgi:hypothetical protein